MKELSEEQIAQLSANLAAYALTRRLDPLPGDIASMRLVRVPDCVEVLVMSSPEQLHGGKPLRAQTRKMRATPAVRFAAAALHEYSSPDSDISSDIIEAEFAKHLARDISEEIALSVSNPPTGASRLLWAPYLPPFLPAVDPTFSEAGLRVRRYPMITCAKLWS